MTIKKFLAIWEVLRHFKSIFSTSLWMLIPGVNIIVAIAYAGNHLEPLIDRLGTHMRDKFINAYDDALDGSREYWTQWGSESALSSLYIFGAFLVNTFCVSFLVTKFPEYSAQIPFSTPDWTFYISIASFIIVDGIILHAISGMAHQVYKKYTTLHPEYAKLPFEAWYIRLREEAIAKRDAIVKVPVRTTAIDNSGL